MTSPSGQSSNTLAAVVAAAIDEGLAAGNRLAAGKTREVDLLAGLFTDGLDKLRATLPDVLKPIGLTCTMHGIYCHQSPKVTTRIGTCELGDLLIAVRFQHGPRIANHALLLQLKVVGRSVPSKSQRALYERWPAFTYVAPPRAMRKVRAPIPHPGAQWGRIELCPECEGSLAPACPVPVTLRSEMPKTGVSRALSDEITDLILGCGGREFSAREAAEKTGGWDLLVWDLIEKTGLRLLNYRRAKLRDEPRRRDLALITEHRLRPFLDGMPGLLSASALQNEPDLALIAQPARVETADFLPPDEPPAWDEAWGDRPDGAISMLLFDIGMLDGDDSG